MPARSGTLDPSVRVVSLSPCLCAIPEEALHWKGHLGVWGLEGLVRLSFR